MVYLNLHKFTYTSLSFTVNVGEYTKIPMIFTLIGSVVSPPAHYLGLGHIPHPSQAKTFGGSQSCREAISRKTTAGPGGEEKNTTNKSSWWFQPN